MNDRIENAFAGVLAIVEQQQKALEALVKGDGYGVGPRSTTISVTAEEYAQPHVVKARNLIDSVLRIAKEHDEKTAKREAEVKEMLNDLGVKP